jgi:hypothetical protein
MIPSGTGHASPERLSCPLLPPSVAGGSVSPVVCGRAGRRLARCSGPRGSGGDRPRRLRSAARRGVPRPSAAPGRVPGTPQPPRRAATVAALWAARGGSARPLLRFASSPCGSGRFAPCGRVREGPALAGTAPLAPKSRGGRRCARSPRPAWPLRRLLRRRLRSGRRPRTAAASLRLWGCAHAVADRSRRAALRRSAPGQLRFPSVAARRVRSLRLRLALSVPLLRRCTATASRQARDARLLRGLAPRSRTQAAKKKRNQPALRSASTTSTIFCC